MLRMLNIGCGLSHHVDWVNVDMIPFTPDVIPCDITKGLPFPPESFDVCYSSHCLEHMRVPEAEHLVAEQRRVLRPGGIIRVVVPDMETICRNYVRYLDELLAGRCEHEFRYDFSCLELFDQMARDRSGGRCAELWMAGLEPPALEYVTQRYGKQMADAIMNQYREKLNRAAVPAVPAVGPVRKIWRTLRRRWNSMWEQRAEGLGLGFLLRRELGRCGSAARQRAVNFTIKLLMGAKAVDSFREGMFRNSGEVHRWMYDRYSLGRLLTSHGFQDVQVAAAAESRIPNFAQYNLDTFEGQTRKPDSLFMEAVRGT